MFKNVCVWMVSCVRAVIAACSSDASVDENTLM